MLKKFKMLIELVSKEETEEWTIWLRQSWLLMQDISKTAKKHNMDCYVKWQPADKLKYIPTWKKYEIKTVEDISELTPEQFEFFIDDLRNFCDVRRGMTTLNKVFWMDIVKSQKEWLTWIDSWLNESQYEFKTTNKL